MIKKTLLLFSFTLFFLDHAFSQQRIYFNDFSTATDWYNVEDEYGSYKVESGRLNGISKSEKSAVRSQNVYIDESRDYSIETSVMHMSGATDYGYGIYFGFKDFSNFFFFTITSSGYYQFACFAGGENRKLKEWTKSDAIKQGDFNWNKIKVEKKQNKLLFYINDVFVAEHSAVSFFGNSLGLVIYNKQSVAYDYMDIQYTDNKYPASSASSVYATNFDYTDKYWSTTDATHAKYSVEGGNYRINRILKDYASWSINDFGVDYSKNFGVETAASLQEGLQTTGYGFILGGLDNKNFLKFSINGQGEFSLLSYVDNAVTTLIPVSKHMAIKKGFKTTNVLRVEKRGDYLQFFVNGVYVAQQFFVDYKGKLVGLCVTDIQAVNFDYFKVDYINTSSSNFAGNTNFDKYKVFYETSFKQPDDIFKDQSTNYGSYKISGRGFLIEGLTEYSANYSAVTIDHSKDFLLESTLSHEAGVENYPFGIVFLYKDPNDFYSYNITANGYFIVYRTLNNKTEPIINWTVSEAARKGNAKNRLGIEKSGGYYKFFINGMKVGETAAIQHTNNTTASLLYVGQKQTIAYENLSVKYTFTAAELNYQKLMKNYQEKATAEPANMTWKYCEEAAKSALVLKEQALYHKLQALVLLIRNKQNIKDRCPCEDAIPVKVWNAVKD